MQRSTAKEIIEWAESQKKQFTIFGSLPVQKFIVNEINAPLHDIVLTGKHNLVKKLITLNRIKNHILEGFPDPTIENTWHPNTHRLIKMRDKFFSSFELPTRHKALRAIWKYFIYAYDYVPIYRKLINLFLKLWSESGWEFDKKE